MGSRGTTPPSRNRNTVTTVATTLAVFAFAAGACVTSGPEGGWKPAPYAPPPPPEEGGFDDLDMDDEPTGPAAPSTATPTASAAPDAPPAGAKDDGAGCSQGSECKSGICEGQGCEPDKGKCMAANRKCKSGKQQLCDCAGKTISVEADKCAGVTYKYPGPCK